MSLVEETPAPLKRHDWLFRDPEKVISHSKHNGSQVSWMRTLSLAFQCVGIIYGDIGTSPLYVYSSTFSNGIKNNDDVLGVLSLILYTLVIIPMLKYVFVVLYANDNGDGGTFALYSLISRYAKIRMIPDQHIDAPDSQLRRAQWVKQKLESSKAAKIVLFTLTILGTSMVIGDGSMTPAISVLSAVSGIREKAPSLTQLQVVLISVAILFMLFLVQRFGTDTVGYTFAPVISVWFILIAGIGMYNLITHDISVLRAINPIYIIQYFTRNGKDGWVSLGGIVLCVTGTEGMFADLGHFNIRAVQISFTGIVFPSVALCYMGQAAYLRKFPENVADTFYKSIPVPMFWPTFVTAILASIIASQAMLSGSFAILSKAQSLGCMPRVRVIHTSQKYEGQVYIPEVNFMMGLASIMVTIAFQTTTEIGNAYGICVVTTFLITTHLMTVVMLLIWKRHLIFIVLFYVVFGSIEVIYLSSILSKFIEGGYLPFCFSLVMMSVMATCHYVQVKQYRYELDHSLPSSEMTGLLETNDVRRIPGVGLLYTELVQGIPPIFPRLINKLASVHSIFIFISVKYLPISRVAPEERFLFGRVGPKKHRLFRCVARYGYSDKMEEPSGFAVFLVDKLKMFIEEESAFTPQNEPCETDASRAEVAAQTIPTETAVSEVEEEIKADPPVVASQLPSEEEKQLTDREVEEIEAHKAVEEEKQLIDREMERGLVYLMGKADVRAKTNSSVLKKIVVNYIYAFLRKNLTEEHQGLAIPQDEVLTLGITYEI